jgi:uncharacterized protein (TIGR03435 family)
MRHLACALVVALLPTVAFGQAAPAPAFEISDVHTSPRTMNPALRGNTVRDGRYEIRNATMVDLIAAAYGVEGSNVVGGPSWLELDRFDVIAKVPPGTKVEAARQMLRTLLADRFKLIAREDSKPLSSFVLSAPGGKHKMTPASGSGPGSCQPVPPAQPPQPGGPPPMQVVQCKGVTMAVFAPLLRQMAGAYVTAPVADQTALTGGFDFELRWHPRVLLTQAGADATTIFDALDKQLGLKLEMKEVPGAVISVDTVDRTPTANLPAVATALPPGPPPEFEVAEIKPTPAGYDRPPQARIQPNGRIDAAGIPLRDIVALAWDVTPEMLVDMPDWAQSAKFDLIARASTDAAPTAGAPPIDIDTLRLMLRGLLVERFQMKTHLEERPVDAYTLRATDKPKLTKADPAARTRCIEGPGPNQRDPRNNTPILSRLITCQNMTMAQFADRIQGLAAGYIRVPVLNATGIDGAFDFSVNFSPIGALQAPAPGAADPGQGGAAAQASLPTGAMSLFDALERQLGLKLQQEKRPNPVLVIDHIERTPLAN